MKPGGSWFKAAMDVYSSSYDVSLDFSDLGDVVDNVLHDAVEIKKRQRARFDAVKPFMHGYQSALAEDGVVATMRGLFQNAGLA